MRLSRNPTEQEWEEIEALGPGLRMYKDKMTLFYNGEINFEENDDGECRPLVHDRKERRSWEVIIALPGVEVIPADTFTFCQNVEVVIMADDLKKIEEWEKSRIHWKF